MRLWSIHPRFLDSQGLVALWRETLLAQKVLAGKTKGYQHHPQLIRFRETKKPMESIGSYLRGIEKEALRRGYQFDGSKILRESTKKKPWMKVTRGQMKYEAQHLLAKLKKRDPALYHEFSKRKTFPPHSIFKVIAGKIEHWEKTL